MLPTVRQTHKNNYNPTNQLHQRPPRTLNDSNSGFRVSESPKNVRSEPIINPAAAKEPVPVFQNFTLLPAEQVLSCAKLCFDAHLFLFPRSLSLFHSPCVVWSIFGRPFPGCLPTTPGKTGVIHPPRTRLGLLTVLPPILHPDITRARPGHACDSGPAQKRDSGTGRRVRTASGSPGTGSRERTPDRARKAVPGHWNRPRHAI